MANVLNLRLLQRPCDSFLSFCRSISYQSSISLKSLYPDSSLKISTPTSAEIPVKDGQKFSGFIPVGKLKITATRSSGPGGQHANKVNTKVDVRFHIDSASWIDRDIREKIKVTFKNKTSADGYMFVSSDKTRSQQLNIAHCLEKLRKMIWQVENPEVPIQDPKDAIVALKRMEADSRERLKRKRLRSETKQFRRSGPEEF